MEPLGGKPSGIEEVGLKHPYKYHGEGLGPSKGLGAKECAQLWHEGGGSGAPVIMEVGGATEVSISSPPTLTKQLSVQFHLELTGYRSCHSRQWVAVGGGCPLRSTGMKQLPG